MHYLTCFVFVSYAYVDHSLEQNSKLADRSWMIVQGEGNRFVTQRQEPLLSQIIPHIDEEKVIAYVCACDRAS